MATVLTGKNTHLLQQYLNSEIDAFVDASGDSIERFDVSEMSSIDDIIDSVRSISFLEPRKLVIVRNFGQSKDLMEKIDQLIDTTADTTELLLVDQKLDKRTSSFKVLKKISDVKEFKQLESYDLEKWLVNEAGEAGGTLSQTDSRYMVERVGQDQQLLKSELDKLLTNSTEITRDSITKLVDATPQSQVFSLLDALFKGKADTAWELFLDQRAQGEEPHKILAMITWQLQQLTMAVYVPGGSKSRLVEAGVSSYSAQKSLDMAKYIDKATIKSMIKELADIDALSKTNADIESALAVYFSSVLVATS